MSGQAAEATALTGVRQDGAGQDQHVELPADEGGTQAQCCSLNLSPLENFVEPSQIQASIPWTPGDFNLVNISQQPFSQDPPVVSSLCAIPADGTQLSIALLDTNSQLDGSAVDQLAIKSQEQHRYKEDAVPDAIPRGPSCDFSAEPATFITHGNQNDAIAGNLSSKTSPGATFAQPPSADAASLEFEVGAKHDRSGKTRRGPMDEMRQLVRILVKLMPQSIEYLSIAEDGGGGGGNRVTEDQIKDYLKRALGESPQPEWGLPNSWGEYVAALFTWARGRTVSKEQALACARRQPGRSWEACEDELRKLGIMPHLWPLPLKLSEVRAICASPLPPKQPPRLARPPLVDLKHTSSTAQPAAQHAPVVDAPYTQPHIGGASGTAAASGGAPSKRGKRAKCRVALIVSGINWLELDELDVWHLCQAVAQQVVTKRGTASADQLEHLRQYQQDVARLLVPLLPCTTAGLEAANGAAVPSRLATPQAQVPFAMPASVQHHSATALAMPQPLHAPGVAHYGMQPMLRPSSALHITRGDGLTMPPSMMYPHGMPLEAMASAAAVHPIEQPQYVLYSSAMAPGQHIELLRSAEGATSSSYSIDGKPSTAIYQHPFAMQGAVPPRVVQGGPTGMGQSPAGTQYGRVEYQQHIAQQEALTAGQATDATAGGRATPSPAVGRTAGQRGAACSSEAAAAAEAPAGSAGPAEQAEGGGAGEGLMVSAAGFAASGSSGEGGVSMYQSPMATRQGMLTTAPSSAPHGSAASRSLVLSMLDSSSAAGAQLESAALTENAAGGGAQGGLHATAVMQVASATQVAASNGQAGYGANPVASPMQQTLVYGPQGFAGGQYMTTQQYSQPVMIRGEGGAFQTAYISQSGAGPQVMYMGQPGASYISLDQSQVKLMPPMYHMAPPAAQEMYISAAPQDVAWRR